MNHKLHYQYFRYRLSSLASIEQDPQVKICFYLLLRKNGNLKSIVETIFKKRPHVTDEHLAYLLFAALQYVSDFEYDYLNIKQMKIRLDKDIVGFSEQIIHLCLNNNLSTHVPNRYSALQIALASINKTNITVIDLGCSAGLGLMALNTETLSTVPSSDERIRQLLKKKIKLEKVVGIDNLLSINDNKWLSACIFPEIKQKRENLKKEIDYFRDHGTRFEYFKINIKEIINFDNLHACFDVVWTSSTLYQIGNTFEESLLEIRPALEYLLAPEGIWIDSYYKKWDIDFASQDNPYQIFIRKNMDFENPLIFLKADSDNIPSLEPGDDFESSLSLLNTIK